MEDIKKINVKAGNRSSEKTALRAISDSYKKISKINIKEGQDDPKVMLRQKMESVLESMMRKRVEKKRSFFGFFSKSNLLNEMIEKKVCDEDGNIKDISKFKNIDKSKLKQSAAADSLDGLKKVVPTEIKNLAQDFMDGGWAEKMGNAGKLIGRHAVINISVVLSDLDLAGWPTGTMQEYEPILENVFEENFFDADHQSRNLVRINENYKKLKAIAFGPSSCKGSLYSLVKNLYTRTILIQAVSVVQKYKDQYRKNKKILWDSTPKEQKIAKYNNMAKTAWNIFNDTDVNMKPSYEAVEDLLDAFLFKLIGLNIEYSKNDFNNYIGEYTQGNTEWKEGGISNENFSLTAAQDSLIKRGECALEYISKKLERKSN